MNTLLQRVVSVDIEVLVVLVLFEWLEEDHLSFNKGLRMTQKLKLLVHL